jgi:hypothetical protein
MNVYKRGAIVQANSGEYYIMTEFEDKPRWVNLNSALYSSDYHLTGPIARGIKRVVRKEGTDP